MSAQSINVLTLSVTSAAALTAHRAVTRAGAHAATDIYGITKFDASAAGQEVACAVQGTEFVEAGAAIPVGTLYVIADAQGRAIAGGNAAACLGKLVRGQSASGAGEFVEIVLGLTV